ncbi:haloacid dehalogenase [Poseidonibacter parvus]|uniref:phosphoglycolate phosphatase n=1 Tax=Poseidonibacter parvus TaxID=1850254 RepID=A0A1P8KPF9_9BACT|nr:HAD hydrolase-like protein [Poseidonibacter parvus]APW66492.1 haloacid dehalogenase [Poseidonibacter parvus]
MSKTIFWDFDGVIIDSMAVRDIGFELIAKQATNSQNIIDEFITYHRYNAGLSRFVKIKHLYENMLNKSISQEEINNFANEFSILMKEKLVDEKYLISQTVEFIEKNYKDYNFHIVSGSEEKELNFLCKELGLSKYFKTIEGSPTHKNDLVKNILSKYKYNIRECILIGDSITDYKASVANNIKFYGFNNMELIKLGSYISNFNDFKKVIKEQK